MDIEIYLNNAESYLGKVEKKYRKKDLIDFLALKKFKNIIECLPEIESAKEIEDELLREVEILLYDNKKSPSRRGTTKKLHIIISLFIILKAEFESLSEQKHSKAENIFLSICAFMFTMLMFLP